MHYLIARGDVSWLLLLLLLLRKRDMKLGGVSDHNITLTSHYSLNTLGFFLLLGVGFIREEYVYVYVYIYTVIHISYRNVTSFFPSFSFL